MTPVDICYQVPRVDTKVDSYFSPQPWALRHEPWLETHSLPLMAENALTLWSSWPRVTAPRTNGMPVGSRRVLVANCPAGEEWTGRNPRRAVTLPLVGTSVVVGAQATLETQTQEEVFKVTQYPNSAPGNDSKLSADASLLERTDKQRVKGRNDPGSLEICSTQHHH